MNATNTPLRKAAILIDSLDRPTADLLLAQMDAAQMRRLGEELLRLGDVSSEERDAVIDEFFRVSPLLARRAGADRASMQHPGEGGDEGVSLELSTAADLPAEEPPTGGPPFGFLHEADSRQLVPFLAQEHPQTIAVVVSHLPPARAAEVVAALASSVQLDVIRRLLNLNETAPEILREVEQGLESRLAKVSAARPHRSAGVPALSAMLQAADPATERAILSNLAAHDRPLAQMVDRRRFDFDELPSLSDADLWTLIEAADPELMMLALAGSEGALVERVLAQFPLEESRRLRRALDHLGPLRLSDVEAAQLEIAQLARQLELDGRIRLPQEVPLRSAA